MPLVHLLTGPPGSLLQATIACGSPMAQQASWDRRLVTCPACLAPRLGPRSAAPGGLTEKQWLQQVVDFARAQGYLAYHTHNSQKSSPGWVDLALAKAGHPLYLIELKVNQGQLSGHQRHWLEVLGQVTGVQVGVWRPGDWELIRQVLCR